ncbi:flagellar protein [Pyrococcus yayanosii]|uniref:flagellar protein n=1 Tax=Pyrococcus yayanosii TaxID=1008460 RepID=UPI00064EFFF3|nr:flagellar protein [Pyrococcus yayanosii]
MGFSVSASAAIIFISFLLALGALYVAWENSYSEVVSAKDYWYSLRLSQINFKIGSISILPYNTTHVNLTFVFEGQTIPGNVDIIFNGIYSNSVDFNYLIPGDSYSLLFPGADTSGNLNHVSLAFANGCQLIITYHYNGTNYVIDSSSTQCVMEVS